MDIRIDAGGLTPTAVPSSLDTPSKGECPPVHYVVFDIETHGGQKGPNRDHFVRTSKHVCTSTYDSETNWVYNYGPDQVGLLVDLLESAPVVVSFNGKGYDVPVLENLLGRKLALRQHVDLFEMIVQSTGELRGYGLESVCQRTLGRGKMGKGVMAAKLYEAGLRGGDEGVAATFELIGYCGGDVRLTRDLLQFIRTNRFICGPHGLVNLTLPDVLTRLA